MDYGKIISTGFWQAWKYKSLWILGFFVAGGGSGNMNLGDDFGDWGGNRYSDIIGDILGNPVMIFFIVTGILALILIFWVLSTISIGGLITAAGRLKRNEEYRFWDCVSASLSYFWRLFGLGILVMVIIIGFLILLGLIGLMAYFIHWGALVMALLIIVPVLIIGAFIAIITSALAERMIVLADRPVFDAIGDSFALWKSHLGPSVLYSLIYLGISIGVGLVTLVIFMFVAVPFVAIGFVNLWVGIILGVPVILLLLLVVEGFTGSAMHLMTTEFYFQLSGLDKDRLAPATTPYAPPSPPPPPANGY